MYVLDLCVRVCMCVHVRACMCGMCRGNSARNATDSGSLPQQAVRSSPHPADGYQLHHSRVSTPSLSLFTCRRLTSVSVPKQSCRHAHPTFDLLTFGSVHAERLPCTVCIPRLVVIARAIFPLDVRHIRTKTEMSLISLRMAQLVPAWVIVIGRY